MAKTSLVDWTPVSMASRWVHVEPREGPDRGKLLPMTLDDARLPIKARGISAGAGTNRDGRYTW